LVQAAILTPHDFFGGLRKGVKSKLPPELRGCETGRGHSRLLKLHYGRPEVHFEAWHHTGAGKLELDQVEFGYEPDQPVLRGLSLRVRPGQTLALTHRTTSREAFAPGVLLAVRQVAREPRFYRGLEELLDLH